MPYRRLPNTDSARIRALKAAYDKGKSIPPFQLAYSQSTFAKVELFINSFEKAMAHYKAAYNHQVEKGKDYLQLMMRASTAWPAFLRSRQ